MQGARILYEASPASAVSFGKYELVEMIGHGGMAEVWKARMVGPAGFNRTVVVKRVLPQLAQDPQFAKMFISEARLSARLTHPNIVQVFELGEFAGQYFLSMEYVRGQDLLHIMRILLRTRSGPPPIELGTVVVRDVCRALAYAHTLTTDDGTPLKIIHRDVTPSNIMVSYDGAAKLLDFGIAKAFDGAGELVTRAGELKGKFAYMAPEQLDPHTTIDHRADLFATGIVLYETLTGSRLFKGANDVETLQLVREARIEPPSARNPTVPPELEQICLRALARDRDERYQDAEQMAIDLDHIVHQMSLGPENIKSILRSLFPNEAPGTGSSSAPPVSVTRSSVPPSSPRTPSTPALGPRKRRWGTLAVGAVLVVGAAIGGWVSVNRWMAPPPTAPAVAARPKPAVTPRPSATPPSPPATVSVAVISTPAHAQVFLDDETAPRGRTPVTLELPRSHDVHQLTLKLPGFPPKMIPLRSDADSRVELALVQAPTPAPAVPRPAVARPAARPARQPTRVVKRVAAPEPKRSPRPAAKPDVVNDPDGQDVLDPFR